MWSGRCFLWVGGGGGGGWGQRMGVWGGGGGGVRLTVSMMSRSASGERMRAARRRSAETRKGCWANGSLGGRLARGAEGVRVSRTRRGKWPGARFQRDCAGDERGGVGVAGAGPGG